MIGSEEKAAVMRVMDSGCLSGYKANWSEDFYGGPEIKALEKEWCEYFGVKHAIAVNSATSGLWAACAAVGLSPIKTKESIWDRPDECVVSPYSMTCSASIPLHFGAKPVFADIEEDYYCLDPASVEERITERTKAIIVVDLFGQPYAADEINAIAKKHGLYIIEDAAQAIGAKYKGRYAGTLGDIGVFSLNFHKHIQCGEGGVVVTDNDELAFKVRLLMNHAEAVMNDLYNPRALVTEEQCKNMPKDIIDGPFAQLVGLNLRMTELQAAVAREQLKKLEGILKVVRENAQYFDVKVRPGCEHAYYRYAVQDEKLLWIANNTFKDPKCIYLNIPVANKYGMREVTLKRHYIVPIHQMPLFKSLGYDQHCCPVCERVEENIVLAWLKEEV